MQFDVYKSFGYPVLRTIVQGDNISLLDYQRSNFDPSISKPQWDVADDPHNFKVSYELGLRVEALLEAVSAGNASMYLYALCKKTFFSKLTKLETQQGTVKYPANLFRYDIELSAFVVADQTFELHSDRFHTDFANEKYQVSKGDVLAWSQPITYSCEREQFRSMSSVFEYASSEEVKMGMFLLNTENDYVSISLHPDFLAELRVLETTLDGKQKLLSGLFVPAVMQLLMEIKEEPNLSEQVKWASVLGQKCRDLNLNLDDVSNYANFAQELLKMPLMQMVSLGKGE